MKNNKLHGFSGNLHFVLILIFLMAFEVRIPMGLVSVTLFELVAYVIFFYTVFADERFRSKNISWSFFYRWTSPILNYSFSIFVVSFLSVIIFKFDGLRVFKDLIPSLILLYMMLNTLRTVEDLAVSYILLCSIMLFSAVLGIMQGVLGFPYVFDLDVESLGKMNIDGDVISSNLAVGLFRHPNPLGLYLIPCVVFCFFNCIVSERPSFKILSFFGAAMTLIAMYYAQTKGAMVWAVAACMMSLVYYRFNEIASLFSVATLSSLIFLIVYFSLTSDVDTLSTMQTRYELWVSGFDVLAGSTVSILLGASEDAMLTASYNNTFGKFMYPNAHNTYLNIILLYGIVPFILYVFMIFKILDLKISFNKNLSKVLGVSSKASIFGLLGVYFFEPAAAGVLINAQFYVLVAFALLTSEDYKNA